MILLATQISGGGLLLLGVFGFLIMMALKPGDNAGYWMRKKRNYRNDKVDNLIIEKVVLHRDDSRKAKDHPWTPKMGSTRKIRVKDTDGYKVNDFMVLTNHSYIRTEIDPTDPTLEIKVLCTQNTIIDDYLAKGKTVDEIKRELL